jgi:hypothetical protein
MKTESNLLHVVVLLFYNLGDRQSKRTILRFVNQHRQKSSDLDCARIVNLNLHKYTMLSLMYIPWISESMYLWYFYIAVPKFILFYATNNSPAKPKLCQTTKYIIQCLRTKVRFIQLVRTCGTQHFVTVLTKALYWTLSQATWIQNKQSRLKLQASRPWKNFTACYRTARSQEHSAASFATLRVLNCLHSPGVLCSSSNVVGFCCDFEDRNLLTAATIT